MFDSRWSRKSDGETTNHPVLLEECGKVDADIDSQENTLEAMFQSLEQVLLLFRRRKQTGFFRQVKAGVEAMCSSRSFTTHHLAQILSVQPGEETEAFGTKEHLRKRFVAYFQCVNSNADIILTVPLFPIGIGHLIYMNFFCYDSSNDY